MLTIQLTRILFWLYLNNCFDKKKSVAIFTVCLRFHLFSCYVQILEKRAIFSGLIYQFAFDHKLISQHFSPLLFYNLRAKPNECIKKNFEAYAHHHFYSPKSHAIKWKIHAITHANHYSQTIGYYVNMSIFWDRANASTNLTRPNKKWWIQWGRKGNVNFIGI